jgi:hypothetical protein
MTFISLDSHRSRPSKYININLKYLVAAKIIGNNYFYHGLV